MLLALMFVTVGGNPLNAVIVTFCGDVKLNPFALAYLHPLQRLVALSTPPLQSSCVAFVAVHVTPLALQAIPWVPPFRATASFTAPRAAASAAACACFWTKNIQPRSTASPMIPAMAIRPSVTSTNACHFCLIGLALIRSLNIGSGRLI